MQDGKNESLRARWHPVQSLCTRCQGMTELVTTIARTTSNPAYQIYKCHACGYVDWVGEPGEERA